MRTQHLNPKRQRGVRFTAASLLKTEVAILNAEDMTCHSHGRKSMVKKQQTSQSRFPGLTSGARAYNRFAIYKTL